MVSGKKKMLVVTIIFIVAVIVAIGSGAFYFFSRANGCNPPLPRENVKVGNTAFDVEIASTATEKSCGLSGRAGLGENQGMIFPFGMQSIQTFWMKDMTFALDIIWIGNGKVLAFAENALPQPGASILTLKIYASPPWTDTVLEVNAGTVAKHGIKVGDAVQVGI